MSRYTKWEERGGKAETHTRREKLKEALCVILVSRASPRDDGEVVNDRVVVKHEARELGVVRRHFLAVEDEKKLAHRKDAKRRLRILRKDAPHSGVNLVLQRDDGVGVKALNKKRAAVDVSHNKVQRGANALHAGGSRWCVGLRPGRCLWGSGPRPRWGAGLLRRHARPGLRLSLRRGRGRSLLGGRRFRLGRFLGSCSRCCGPCGNPWRLGRTFARLLGRRRRCRRRRRRPLLLWGSGARLFLSLLPPPEVELPQLQLSSVIDQKARRLSPLAWLQFHG